MKKFTSIFMVLAVLWSMTFLTSCLGSFKITSGLYNWNKGIGNKIAVNAVFWVAVIIPVYEIFLFIDIVILNLIEFWSGGDPTAMKDGDMEQQLVMGKDGNSYQIIATKNRFDIVQLDGIDCGNVQSLVYNPEEKSWSHVKDGASNKLVQFSEDGSMLEVFTSYTEPINVPTNVDLKTAQNMVRSEFDNMACL